MATSTTNRPNRVEPYLFFEGCCDDAIAFYRQVLGAEVLMLMRFKESPDQAGCPAGMGDKVMHAALKIGETTIMASDGRCSGARSFDGFALSIAAPDETTAERWFGALAEGGQIQMPMTKTFFSPKFGMTRDRFGVFWMVMVAQSH